MPMKKDQLEAYVQQVPEERRAAFIKLHTIIKANLPKGFQEIIKNGPIEYVVPHTIYPKGYHCKPTDPLPFVSLAAQKNFIAIYHMGIYAEPSLLNWFTTEYPKHSSGKLDMGKSCIRLKKADQIPYELIGQLASKMNPAQWITLYEKAILR